MRLGLYKDEVKIVPYDENWKSEFHNVRRELIAFFKALRNVGFYRLRVERLNEIICAKFIDDTFETKTHFIRIAEFQKEKWH